MFEKRIEKRECWLGERVTYQDLHRKSKLQESYNAAQLRGVMAEWGYLDASVINGDSHGADLLFYRYRDAHVLKVQLKGRPALGKGYIGKNLHIAYPDRKNNCWYIYPHDEMMAACLQAQPPASKKCWHQTKSWVQKGGYSWPSAPRWMRDILSPYRVQK